MSRDLPNRYIWLVDTIRRFGRITLKRLCEQWRRSPFYDGNDLQRRTFCNYRLAAEKMLGVTIACDNSTFEYYIKDDNENSFSKVADWLLNSTTTSELLSRNSDLASRILLEDVPSARQYLSGVVEALRSNATLKFDYHAFNRRLPSRDVMLEPLFLKIFRQRWYVTGRNIKDRKIKTYALDRITSLEITDRTFVPDPSFDAQEYARESFGVVFSGGEPRHIELKVDAVQAKYFRALPFHNSQQEYIHDEYSIFTYKMRLTPDLVDELMSYGPKVTVLQPPSLKNMLVERLKSTLDNYNFK